MKKTFGESLKPFVTLVFVGDELLSGRIQNTSAQTLSRLFHRAGYKIAQQKVIADDEKCIENVILEDRSPILIICGGLGATKDDVTISAAARGLGKQLVYDREYLTELKKRQKKNNLDDSFLLQARKPRGALLMPHTYGTAPFLAVKRFFSDHSANVSLKKSFGWVYFLAGVPKECFLVAKDFLLPHLQKNIAPQCFFSCQVVVVGIAEIKAQSMIESLFSDEKEEVNVSYLPRESKELFLIFSAFSQKNAEKKAKEVKELFLKSGYYAYVGEDSFTLHVHKKLQSSRFSLALAESCTGGGLGAALVQYAGASHYLMGSLVTYHNLAKMIFLGVKKKTLSRYGAVSEQTAVEMLEGLFRHFPVDIGVAITGIAGPKVDQKDKKPVGLVYIGMKYPNKEKKLTREKENIVGKKEKNEEIVIFECAKKSCLVVKKFLFAGDRRQVQNSAIGQALKMLMETSLFFFFVFLRVS